MVSEPRKCLFDTLNRPECENLQTSKDSELKAIMDRSHKEFVDKYSLDSGPSNAKTQKIDWDEENQENIPEFYSRNPKRKCIDLKKSVKTTTHGVDWTLSPLQRRLGSLNIQQSLQR